MKANLKFVMANGTVLRNEEITFPETTQKWKQISTTTGTYINAGTYKVIISFGDCPGLGFNSLEIQ